MKAILRPALLQPAQLLVPATPVMLGTAENVPCTVYDSGMLEDLRGEHRAVQLERAADGRDVLRGVRFPAPPARRKPQAGQRISAPSTVLSAPQWDRQAEAHPRPLQVAVDVRNSAVQCRKARSLAGAGSARLDGWKWGGGRRAGFL
ncbi:hypothetical protein AURDEDRAFT_116628, partial [Auricularia subglabra TFB-10046 SS5]